MTSTAPAPQPSSVRWSRAFVAVAVVGLVAAAATGSDLPDPDIWWNLVEGEAVLDTGDVPPLETFGSHGCIDANDLDNRVATSAWALAWRAGGMWGLVLLRALLVAAAGLAVLWTLRRAPLLVAMSWACCLAAGLAFRASARPELVGLVLLAWCLALIVDVVGEEHERRGLVLRLGLIAGLELTAVFAHATFVFAPAAAVILLVASFATDRRGPSPRRAALALAAATVPLLARPQALLLLIVAGEERAIAHALGFLEYAPLIPLVRDGFLPPSLAPIAILVLAPVAALALRPVRHGGSGSNGLSPVVAIVVIAPFVVLAASMMRALAPLAVVAAIVGGRALAGATEARRTLAVLLAASTLLVIPLRLAEDPALQGRRPPDFAPTRLTPLEPSRYFAESGFHGLVYAGLHLGNWLLLENRPAVRVVWSGRRTYSLACGQELLRGRRGGHDFALVDERLRPDAVLVSHALERALVASLVERGWSLAHLDLRYAVFLRPAHARTSSRSPSSLPVRSPEALLDAENRNLDPTILAGLFASACEVLRSAAPASADDVCRAAAALGRRAATP